MKTVVNKNEVAHLWANQLQRNARTPGTGSLFFEGDTIYSYGYHFRIAKHVTNSKGETAILFTERGYSNSTAKHISTVRNATHGNIISVSTLDSDSYDATPDAIFNKWRDTAENIAIKLKTARKPEIYLNQLNNLKYTVTRYSRFFDLEVPTDLYYILNVVNKDQYLGYEDAKNKAAAELKDRQKREAIKQTEEQIKKFKDFKANEVRTRAYGFDYLRFNVETNRVETSQYVQIPAEIAKNFYRLVLDKISNGGCNNCDTILMDRYRVTEINKNFIKVGCHTIEIKEIKALTKKLGW